MPAGTWNLPKIRKTVPYRGIKDVSTIELFDTTSTSPNYFNVLDFPDRLTSGKNLIKLNAANETLADGSDIHIEILDYNGDPIYYEPLNYLEQDGTRVIAIYVYPNTSPGLATVYIAGRASVNVFEGNRPLRYTDTLRPSGTGAVEQNALYKNYPNLLWSRTINVAPEKRNSSQIIFTQAPKVTVAERVVNYQQPITLNNVNVATSASNATITIDPVPVQGGLVANAASLNATFQAMAEAPMSSEGQFSLGTPLASAGSVGTIGAAFAGMAAASVDMTSNSSITNAAIATIQSPADVPAQATDQGPIINSGYSRATFTNFPLSSSMEGGLLVVKNPVLPVDLGTVLVGSPLQVQPAADIPSLDFRNFMPDAISIATDVAASGSVVFVINDVESTTQAKVSQLAGPGHAAPVLSAYNFVALKTGNNTSNLDGTLGQPTVYDIKSISATANFTSSHTLPLVYSTTAQSQSFAEVVVANIEPATGDVYKIRTSYKPAGQFGDFLSAGDTILERIELLQDTGSFEGTISIGQINNRMGYFTSEADFNEYFIKANPSGIFNDVAPSFEPDVFMNSIKLENASSYNTTNNRACVIQLRDEHTPTVQKNSRYAVRFQLKCVSGINSSDSLTYTDGGGANHTITKPRFDVYIKGSEGQGTIQPIQETYSAYRLTDYDINATNLDELADDGNELGKLIGVIEMNPSDGSLNSLLNVLLSFETDTEQTIQINLVQRAGVFAFKDLGITTDAETGFSPNHTRLNIRIPSEFIDVPMIFKFEYFDYLSQKADVDTVVYPIKFVGDNTVITGENNLLSGSVFIGNTIGSGIELAGVSSGFIRTIGYEGFTSASRTDKPGGFMMYTGSVLPNTPDGYEGVGLELVADSGSFLRFATAEDVSGKPSGLEVQTQRFFLGSDSQFISGANGNIEISSSNFHLQNDGDVVMQGKITAEAGGSIGGFDINSDNLTGDNFILNTTEKRLTLGTGNTIFIADADEGIFLGNSSFASAPFSVDLNGALKATDADITGKISATSGDIGGFSIDTATISSSNDALILKDSGQISGSTVLFDGGTIGGFDLGPAIISSSNGNLILKDSGQITGSNVLFNGGVIGGFTLTDSKLSQGNILAISSSTNEGDPAGFISSSAFKVSPGGQVTGSSVLFSGGKIANFTVSGDNILGGDNLLLDSDAAPKIKIAPSSVTSNTADQVKLYYDSLSNWGIKGRSGGNTMFELGSTNQIAGWTFDDTQLIGGNMIIRKDGTIESSQFASGVAGSGFRLTADLGGFLEVENANIRGTLATAVFEKETVNAVGGQLYVANSTTLTSSIIAPEGIHSASMTTMSVVNVSGFAQGEILTAKKISETGFATEYIFVNSASRQDASSETDFSGFLFVERGYSGSTDVNSITSGSVGDIASQAQSYSGSQVIVSTGKVGTGYIRLNANPNDQTTPYIDIVERTGSSIYDIDLKARLGDLSGLSSARLHGTDPSGQFGLYTKNAFLEGGIIANTGSIGGINMRDNKLFTGAGVHDDVNTGFFASSSGLFSLGDKLVWDGTNLAIAGSITITGGTDVITPADTGSMLANATGSLPTAAQISASIAASTGSLVSNASTSSLENPSQYSFGGAGFDLTTHTAAAGLNLTSKFVGYHDGASFQTFMSSSGDFYLGGTDGVFQWDAAADSLHMSGSLVELNVPTFFFGEEGATPSTFISGSQGNLEISSSNFHLLPTGDVTMSGEIKASGGEIGGWSISDTKLSNGSDIVLDSSNKSISINNSTFATDGLQMEHTAGSSKFYVGDGSTKFLKWGGSNLSIGTANFSLSTAGVIAATNVNLSGTITATAGTIGGWTAAANSLSAGSSGTNSYVLLDQANTLIQVGGNSKTRTVLDGDELKFFTSSVTHPIVTLKAGVPEVQGTTLFGSTIGDVVNPATGATLSGVALWNPQYQGSDATQNHKEVRHSGLFISGARYEIAHEKIRETMIKIESPGTAGIEDHTETKIQAGMITIKNAPVYGHFSWAAPSPPPYIQPRPSLRIEQNPHVSGAFPGNPTHAVNIKNLQGGPGIVIAPGVDLTTDADEGHISIVSTDGDIYPNNVVFSPMGMSVKMVDTGNAASNYTSAVGLYVDVDDAYQYGSGTYTFYGVGTGAALYNQKNILSGGNIVAFSSDRRLKENIFIIKNPIEKLKKLRGVEFDWKDGLDERLGFVAGQKHDIGMIAQELEEVVPEAVYRAPFDNENNSTLYVTGSIDPSKPSRPEKIRTDGETEPYKTIKMEKVIPILIESLKEQQKQIELLTKKINKLEK